MGRNYFESGVSFSSNGHSNGNGEKFGKPYTVKELTDLDIFVPNGAQRAPVDPGKFSVTETTKTGRAAHGVEYQVPGVVLTPLVKEPTQDARPHRRNGMILGGTSKKALNRASSQMRAGR